MSTVELINEQVTFLQKRLAQETAFNDGLKVLINNIKSAVGDINVKLQYIGCNNDKVSLLTQQLEAETKKLQDREDKPAPSPFTKPTNPHPDPKRK